MEKSVRGQIFFFWRGIIRFSLLLLTLVSSCLCWKVNMIGIRVSGFHWNWEGDLGPGCLLFPLALVQKQNYLNSTGLFLKVSWISLNLPEKTFQLAWIFLLNDRKITEAQSAWAVPAHLYSYIFLHSTVHCNYIRTDKAVHKTIKNMNSNILLPFPPINPWGQAGLVLTPQWDFIITLCFTTRFTWITCFCHR